ncbi:phosphatase PAP2 family protein [Pontibacter sp. HSC-14F20]|uniref:phosphatase PAP2 family protein n=1 Tax=Pontibacter sp. HSC-14F20 TaxID=2864136 RepID=UPI001C72BDA4|nr:phosphatase PAP2 family protein [Pontibacter sp. HSC-14F20]MBX0331923.1 phosphatase PAP2 family protein [Pontibacter sp. HSC-14F20]
MKLHVYAYVLFFLVPASVWAHQAAATISHIPDTAVVSQLADTTAQVAGPKKLSVIARRAAIPVLLIGLGVTHMDDEGLFEGSRGLRRVVQKEYSGFNTRVDDYLYQMPVALTVGLNLAGVKGEHHYAEQALLLGMSHFLNRVLTNNLKTISSINRPDGSSDDAFPSAHTSKAFAYATFFHREYGSRSIWYSVAGYSVATATGALRILNDRHWLSDVLAGAGIGILSTEIVYQVYPKLQQIIDQSFHRKQQNQVIFMPYYSGGAGGIALVWQLR